MSTCNLLQLVATIQVYLGLDVVQYGTRYMYCNGTVSSSSIIVYNILCDTVAVVGVGGVHTVKLVGPSSIASTDHNVLYDTSL